MTTPTKLEHKNLTEALTAVQGEMTDPVCDSENPHFKSKYTSLTACLALARPILAKHGILLIQRLELQRIEPDTQDCRQVLITELRGYGETLESRMPIVPVKNDPQGMGSAISYARRYTLKPMLNMAEDDDDGNAASDSKQAKQQKQPAQQAKPKPAEVGTLESRKTALVEFYKNNIEVTENYLHAPTFGRGDHKEPWLGDQQAFENLSKEQVEMICRDNNTLARFCHAVLEYNGLVPPNKKAA